MTDLDRAAALLTEAASLLAADAASPDAVSCEVIKAADEQRYTLGVALAANRPDPTRGLDGCRDAYLPAEVEKAAWSYMGTRVQGLRHADGTTGHGEVVESYVYRGPDWEIAGPDGATAVVKAGDWLVGTVWDADTWTQIKGGLLGGLSVQGVAKRRLPTEAERAHMEAR